MRFPATILLTSLLAVEPAPPVQTTPPQIKVDVDLVLVTATVTDNRNRFVQGLERGHFQLWEDRIEQEIVHFSTEDTPVSLGIVVDRSGSMGGAPGLNLLATARSTAYGCLEQSLRDDEFFLIEFSDQAQVVADFTSNISKLKERLLFTGAGGRTALWDAIYAGVNKLEDSQHARKALLVLTDGKENKSRYTLTELKGIVREREIRIYSMNLDEVALDAMADLTELTGGRIFRSRTPCQELAADLKNQYVLGYIPINRSADGAFRSIRVRVDTKKLPKELSNLSVRARAGYYAQSSGDAKPVR
jgi:Ca-activated chloride channel homolog